MQNPRSIKLAVTALALLYICGTSAAAQTPCQGGAVCGSSAQTTATFTATHGQRTPAWATDITLPAFDVALGDLARVDITATVPIDGSTGFENLDSTYDCPGGNWWLESFISLTFVQGGTNIMDSLPISISSQFGPLATFDGSLDFRGPSGETTTFADTIWSTDCSDDSSGLHAFRSDVVGPLLTFTALTTPITFSISAPCAHLANLHDTRVGMEIEITYTYCVPGTRFCTGDGSASPCPCGNRGAPGHGCANGSFASGSALTGSGNASVSSDTLVLSSANSTPNQPGLFFQGEFAVNGGDGVPFGDGLRCAGGNVVRLEARTADGSGSASTTIGLAVKGGVSAGETRRYQWWHRDPAGSPCGAGFNLSNGLEIIWAP